MLKSYDFTEIRVAYSLPYSRTSSLVARAETDALLGQVVHTHVPL